MDSNSSTNKGTLRHGGGDSAVQDVRTVMAEDDKRHEADLVRLDVREYWGLDMLMYEYSYQGTTIPLRDVVRNDCGESCVKKQTLARVIAERVAADATKEAKRLALAELSANQLAEAKRTGKPVVIASWVTDECMSGDPMQQCSCDLATKLMMPDGTIQTSYSCRY
jgi:hypothetical protein